MEIMRNMKVEKTIQEKKGTGIMKDIMRKKGQ